MQARSGFWVAYLSLTDCTENFDKALESETKKLLGKVDERLRYESKNVFFACTKGCARFKFDEASEANFTCSFCRGNLEYMEMSKIVETIERQIKALQNCLVGKVSIA